MSLSKYRVGLRVWWRCPPISDAHPQDLYMMAIIESCRTRLGKFRYQLKLLEEVWGETLWGAREEDILEELPRRARIWKRTIACRRKPERKKKAKR